MDFGIRAGDTSQTVYIRLRDSTTGLGKTGLLFNSTGATCSYTLPGAARAAITLATLASASAGWATGGFILVDDTNCKGLYRLDLPNAAIASGKFTVISIEFDGIIEESLLIPLTNPVNVIELGGSAQSATDLQDFADAGYDPATNKVQGVVLCDTLTTYTGNTKQTGDTYALANGTAGFVAIDTVVDTILLDTNELQTDDIPTTLATLATAANLSTVAGYLDTEIAAILVDTGTTIPALIGTPAADIAADIAAVKAETATILVDTGTTLQAELDGIQADTEDIQTRIPAALVGGLMSSDVTAIATDTTAPTNLAASALGIVPGACEGTPSTTVIQTDLAEATDDHYIGRIVVFTSGVAAGQASDITDYTGSTGTLTVTALTTAPAAADTFVVV